MHHAILYFNISTSRGLISFPRTVEVHKKKKLTEEKQVEKSGS